MNTVSMVHSGQTLYLSDRCKTEPGSHGAFVPCSGCQLAGMNKSSGQFENCQGMQIANPEKR